MEDSLGNSDLSTMPRLKAGYIKCGKASQEHNAGSQRQVVNIMRTDTLHR
jgi:hypothetical protein